MGLVNHPRFVLHGIRSRVILLRPDFRFCNTHADGSNLGPCWSPLSSGGPLAAVAGLACYHEASDGLDCQRCNWYYLLFCHRCPAYDCPFDTAGRMDIPLGCPMDDGAGLAHGTGRASRSGCPLCGCLSWVSARQYACDPFLEHRRLSSTFYDIRPSLRPRGDLSYAPPVGRTNLGTYYS